MKILYLSDILTVHDRKFLYELASRHSVILLTFKDSGLPDELRKIKGLTVFHLPVKDFVFEEPDDVLTKIAKKIKNGINFIKKYFYLRRVISRVKPEALHAGWVQSSGYLAALSGFHPFLLMPWGSDILLRPHINKRQMNITRRVLTKADKIICDCENVKKKIIEISGRAKDKVVVFPWGVDLNLFKPAPSSDKFLENPGWRDKKIIISTRSFEKIYGLKYLVEAIPEVIKAAPCARFIFCGEGADKKEINNLVDKLNLEKYVHFAGYVKPSVLPAYLNAADVYVSTSLSDGTSISLLEAFACGKPAVVTDVPSNLEWVKEGEGGFIVPRKDSKLLAGKIVKILNDKNLAKNMGEFNRKVVEERADWDKNFGIIEKVYEELTLAKNK